MTATKIATGREAFAEIAKELADHKASQRAADTAKDLNLHYWVKVMRAELNLSDAIQYSIQAEDMKLYIALKDARDALGKVIEILDEAGA